ncbi:hypothetical protein HAX54_029160, partial [Datura stramonium]|nr:hypothetical protein [Datura stramonium]
FHLGINPPLKHPKIEHDQLPTLVEGIVTNDTLTALIMNYGDNGSPEYTETVNALNGIGSYSFSSKS